MARVTANMRQPVITDLPAYPGRESACGFCIDKTPKGVRHDLCPGEIHTAEGKANNKVWTCQCWKERHPCARDAGPRT